MSVRFEEMEAAFREKEYRLVEHKRQLDEEHRLRQSKIDDIEKRFLERDIYDRWKYEIVSNASTLDKKPFSAESDLLVRQRDLNDGRKHEIASNTSTLEKKPFLGQLDLLDKQRSESKIPKGSENITNDGTSKEKSPSSNLTPIDHLNIKLNLTPFSGKELVPRHESSFEEFKLEFENVRYIYSELVLKRALMKTLKEQARKTMLHLGTEATVDNIMKGLEENFGNVASGDNIMSRFLLAEQNVDESIVGWGLRLEEMLLQVCRKFKMDETERKAKLKNRFWRGLRNDELRQATRSYFDSPMAYEELRNKVRSEEYEIKLVKERSSTSTKSGKLNQESVELHSTQTENMIAKLLKQVQELDRKFEDMKKSNEEHSKVQNSESSYRRGGYRRPRRGGNRGLDRGNEKDSSEKQTNSQDRKKDHEDGKKTPLNF